MCGATVRFQSKIYCHFNPLTKMEIMKYPEKKEQLVLIITKEGSEKGVEFILNNYDNDIITPDLARWICQRRLADFHNGGKYADQYKD